MSSCRLVARLAMAMVLCTLTFTVSAAVTSNRTRAECSGSANRWPAFSRMAPSARRIFVGTVIEGLNAGPRWFGRYRVRVDEVLRGPRREFMVIDFMTSGTPPSGSGACRRDRYLQAKVGDVIAFALGGRTAGVRGPCGPQHLEGRPSGWNPGIERLSLPRCGESQGNCPIRPLNPPPRRDDPDGADTLSDPTGLAGRSSRLLRACDPTLHVAAQDGGLVDDAIRFRRSVGLRADRDFVASTFGSDQYAADEFGVPLSEQEVAEIQERQFDRERRSGSRLGAHAAGLCGGLDRPVPGRIDRLPVLHGRLGSPSGAGPPAPPRGPLRGAGGGSSGASPT